MDARKLIALLVALPSLALLQSPAWASDCSGNAAAGDNVIAVNTVCDAGGHSSAGHEQPAGAPAPVYEAYGWSPACDAADLLTFCNFLACPPGQVPLREIGLRDGVWYPLGIRCLNPLAVRTRPTVTPDLVARAFQRIPLPKLRSVTQPAGKTLVNFDTIFHVDAQPLDRQLTLLGQRVQLRITPSSFRWVHGDGTTATTSTPGAAYPSKEVVHRYQAAHVTVSHHVEVTWTAQWRLNGGGWQPVPGSVTTVGPATALEVAEAVPALSGER